MTDKESNKKCKNVLIVLVLAFLAFATSIVVLLLVAGSGSQEEAVSTATETTGGQDTLSPVTPSTLSPTLHPSAAPSLLRRPTSAPTTNRTLTLAPTGFPTTTPTDKPTTANPTTKPTASPTRIPVEADKNATNTISLMPVVPVDEGLQFRLKMFWQEGFFWQEEERERFWCVECTKCETLNFGDDGAGCSLVGWECEAGNQLWIEPCRKGYGHVFEVLHKGQFDQIKLANSDLCWERTKKRYITVQACDSDNIKQLWSPLSAEGGFEIKPADSSKDDEEFCATQQHHPKPDEIVGLKDCELAHKWDTGYWQIYELGKEKDQQE